MPPLQVFEHEDTVSTMIRFQTSPIYEMIVSLETLALQRRRVTWANQVRNRFSPDFWEEVSSLMNYNKLQYIELPVDYPNHDDVPGFIRYVRKMSVPEFAFYVTGRLLPPVQMAGLIPDFDGFVDAVKAEYGDDCHLGDFEQTRRLFQNIPHYQARLTDLWERYWNEYFAEFVESLHSSWASGLKEAERVLEMHGSDGLFEDLMGRKMKLPEVLVPAGQPYTDITFIPIYLIPYRALMFFGYGNVTVLFDSEYTEARVAQIEKGKEEALNTVRALGDTTRLSVLRLIAQHEGKLNGKSIAAKLNLSASAVSRHLTQLRDSGLIIEEPLDHRNITYRVQRETIVSLPDKILDYLYS